MRKIFSVANAVCIISLLMTDVYASDTAEVLFKDTFAKKLSAVQSGTKNFVFRTKTGAQSIEDGALVLKSSAAYATTTLGINITDKQFHENMGFALKLKLKVIGDNADRAFYVHLGFGFSGHMVSGQMPLDYLTAWDPVPLTLIIYPDKNIAELRQNRVLISKNTFAASTDSFIDVTLNINSAGYGNGIPAFADLKINDEDVAAGHFYWYALENRWTKEQPPKSNPVFGVTGKSSLFMKDLTFSLLEEKDQIRPSLSMGALKPFWKYQPVLGPFLMVGQGIHAYNDWDHYKKTDFPYPRKRGSKGDVLFANGVNVVRLLGGIDDQKDKTKRELDLAYRDKSGKIKYSWSQLKKKLAPYKSAGVKEYTFVLDNIPYCFLKKPVYGPYGQVGGPDSHKEWAAFVSALCRQLRTILGSSKANKFRFRLLTEARLFVEGKGGKKEFATTEDYLKLYETTAKAIRKVLPKAKFGPYNQSAIGIKNVILGNIKHVNFTDMAKFTKERNLPFDFMGASKYYTTVQDPDLYAFVYMNCFKNLQYLYPHLADSNLEIHEWGLNYFESKSTATKVPSVEPGAFGTSLIAHKIIRLGEQGLDRLYHWGLLDLVRKNATLHKYLTGHGYLYLLMDKMIGGHATVYRPQQEFSINNTKHLCLGSSKKNTSYFLLTAHNTDMAIQEKETVRYLIPKSHIKHKVKKVSYVVLNRTTDPYTVIRNDLEKAGHLNRGYIDEPLRISKMRDMISKGKVSEIFLADHMDKYVGLLQKNLTLKPSLVKLESKGDYYEVKLDMAPPETLMLVVE
jgi:hypothetical protein